MKTSESLGSVSSSASSALSGYAGGCSECISGRSGCLCLGGEVYTGRVVTVESEERRRADRRLRWWPRRWEETYMATEG